MADVKRLVFSILQFLESQRESGQLDEEAKESLEVAVQCLEQVYKVNTAEGEFVMKYSVPKNLVDIFAAQRSQIKSDTTNLTQEATEEQKEEAEKLKNKGNDYMKMGKFEEALVSYSHAIRLDSKNAVYFCNRAAAYSKLNQHQEAIEDCNKALAIDANYSKAYGRMGIAFTALNNHHSAYDCYHKALELEPDNQSYKTNFEISQQKINENTSQTGFGSAPSVPPGGLGALAGLGNINFGTLFSDPNIVNMATSIMSNPQILQMSQQVASQMQQINPDLVQQLRQQMRGHNQTGSNSSSQNSDQDSKPTGE